MSAAALVSLPLRVGARTVGRIHRRLHVSCVDLEQALASSRAVLPPLAGHADGWLIHGLPAAACAALPAGFHLVERHRYARHYADLSLGFDPYLERFSAKRRSTLRRKERRLAERSGGKLDIRVYRTPTELEAFFRFARPLSARTYQEQRLNAGLPDTAGFRAAAAALAAADAVRAWLLFVENAPVAYLYAPASGRTLVYDYLGYDPAFADLSPGTVLQLHAMRALMEEGRFRWFDFTGGDGEHKRQFATGNVPCVDVLLLRPGAANAAAAWLLRSFDASVAAAKRMLMRLGGEGLVRLLRR